MFASVRTKTVFLLLQKELCVRWNKEMRRDEQGKHEKISRNTENSNAERKEAKEHKNFSGKRGSHRTIKEIFQFHYLQHYLNTTCR